jgi:predicted dehydrogenase
MNNPIPTAVLSYGMSGRVFHAPILHVHPGFSMKTVWERSKNLSTQRYPYVKIFREYNEILQDKGIELIIVNTPDDTHHEYAKMALLAGKHVVIEKPFTQTVEEAEELIAIAEKQGLVLSSFQNRRWDSDFLTVQHVIEQQLVGRLVVFESHFDRYRKEIRKGNWKDQSSSSLYNLGSHLIDQALVLFGMPSYVLADLRQLRDHVYVNDYYEIILDYTNFKVTLKSSYLVRERGPRFIIHGTEGSFLKFGYDIQEERLKNGHYPDEEGWGKEPEKKWGLLNTHMNNMHFKGKIETVPGNYFFYYSNIYDAIRNHANLDVSPYEALNVMRIIEKAKESSQDKKYVSVD